MLELGFRRAQGHGSPNLLYFSSFFIPFLILLVVQLIEFIREFEESNKLIWFRSHF